ncbi:MAG: M55 family metallopeptidase [Lentisphaeria bacterium]|jgi:D-amino peptidase|nr:M55 family metallopeptidase [Lentisphaeria bacterium]MDY0175889.1 M55 family metallopeptidase [Lentisphaeria bacterium]NLZ59862.1 M55 family metallopeptidase [Lentisphaerota bacterium]
MRIYVQTDIEGVAGFCFYENRRIESLENHAHRQRMYRLLTNEVNAAVKAAFDSGADEVLVNDNHGSGYNIIFEDLDPRCRIIHGRNSSGPQWLNMLDKSIDAMVLVGMHAMGGTENSITPHSLWKVNGGQFYMSEASMAAAIAGDFNVPTVFISGDDKISAEVADKIPGIQSAVVKEALGAYMACSLIPSRACQLIYEGVKRGIALRKKIAPYKVAGPIDLALLDSPNHCLPFSVLCEVKNSPSILQAFNDCEDQTPWYKRNTKLPDGFIFPPTPENRQ